MSQSSPRNMAASVKGRLLQNARAHREEFQSVLTRYAIERFLYRLSRSPHRKSFVVKGANLFLLWMGAAHRPTRDLDLLGYGTQDVAGVVGVFQAICRQPVEDDGMTFDAESVQGNAVRENEKYAGLQITVKGMLGTAVIKLQVDIGFGDVIVPTAQEAVFPSMLGVPGAALLIYPRETVVAEKCEAMIDLGLGNSRLKDFYDLWHLASRFDFEGLLLCQAMSATFQRRGTTLTTLPPPALTEAFYEDAERRRQWKAFVEKSGLPIASPPSLAECAHLLGVFLLPLLHATQDQVRFQARWYHTSLTWVGEQV